MTIEIRQLEWQDHNSQRSFPFAVEATQQDVSGTITIPDDFILSLDLATHSAINVDPSKFLIRRLGSYVTGYGLTIGYDNGSDILDVATANIAKGTHTPGRDYSLTGLGDFSDTTGTIVLGKTDNLDNQPAGDFSFDLAGARLEPFCIRPFVRSLMGVRVANGSDLSTLLYGDLVFSAGTNQRITVVQTPGQPTEIIFDAIDGEGLNDECVCEDDLALSPPIRRINGEPGTSNGDFTVLGNDCLSPERITNGIYLNDTCSKPCCGCRELEVVTAQLEQFGRQATTLENLLVSLQARVTQMDQVVLGSRLGDRGCVDCD